MIVRAGAAQSDGRATPAIFGNLYGLEGQSMLGFLMSAISDVVWVETHRFNVARGTFADTNIGSVADRINQQKHYVQRGHRASAENFLKRS